MRKCLFSDRDRVESTGSKLTLPDPPFPNPLTVYSAGSVVEVFPPSEKTINDSHGPLSLKAGQCAQVVGDEKGNYTAIIVRCPAGITRASQQ